MTAWANLPNAPHIDRILEHAAKKPTRWDAARGAARDAAWGAARDAAWGAARDAARDAAWDAARDAAWDAAWGAARDAARDAAWDAVCALIAWDDCAYLLDLTPETVRGIVRISNSPAAVLLLPAVTALQPEGV